MEKKRTVTSDLKIDGKKEITAQERLLTCKERGIEEGFRLRCALAALWSVFSAYFYFQVSIQFWVRIRLMRVFPVPPVPEWVSRAGLRKKKVCCSAFIPTLSALRDISDVCFNYRTLFSLTDQGSAGTWVGELQPTSPQAPTNLECSSLQAPYSARRIDHCHKNSFQIIATVQPSV